MRKFTYKMTIIVPSYNNGQYIRQALDSILMQKVDFNYQIIITDDCSQDDSPEIIKEYEEKYSDRILALYSDKNCRLFQNVLKALEKMDSEYFCVLDPDDYWTDERRLQKAVDFLDNHPEYTIYGTNAYKLYNDGTVELYYNYPAVNEYTSTYEDFLKRKSILSNTFASTYRNVYFSNGIPNEYTNLIGSQFEEMFRADTARNLIHLKKGKAYFLNESVGYSRRHGKGLSSSLKEYEQFITYAFAYIAFYNFFGKENKEIFENWIKGAYIAAVGKYYQELVVGSSLKISEQYREYFKVVMEWLPSCSSEKKYIRVPFSLKRFSELAYKKTIIWGTGQAASRIIREYHIPIHEKTFFVDNNNLKHGSEFMGRPVKSPESIKNEDDTLILIASSHYIEILEQIRKQKLCAEEHIINIYDFEKNAIW